MEVVPGSGEEGEHPERESEGEDGKPHYGAIDPGLERSGGGRHK